MNKQILQWCSHSRGSITAGGGWHDNGWREYTKIYVLGRTKAFLSFNVVCLDVRKIAGAQRWRTRTTLVHDSVCVCTHPHTHTYMHALPEIYFPSGRRREWGEQRQCSEADVITKGNTSRVSPSLSDPHGGSKSELIRVPQNGEIFQQRWQVLPALFRCDTLGRWWWWWRWWLGSKWRGQQIRK